MHNEALLRDTEAFLREQIPLTRAMGVRVESWGSGELRLSAPLEPNHNHLGTAFGGSLSALATLAGYSLLWLRLGNRDAHIVIRESVIRYRRPVHGELQAICRSPAEVTWAEFEVRFAETGKANLTLQVSIVENGEECVAFSGEYVAIA